MGLVSWNYCHCICSNHPHCNLETDINQDLIPQAGKTLGDSGNPWSSLTSNKVDLGAAGSFASGDNAIIADSVEGMEFHTPANDAFRYMFGTNLTLPSWTLSKTTLIGSDSASGIQLESHLTLFDTAVDNADPTVDGQFRNVGGRVKVRTNGVVKDLTDTGSGVSDGDKGDITVTSSGSVWTIDNGLAKSKISTSGTWADSDLPSTVLHTDQVQTITSQKTFSQQTIFNAAIAMNDNTIANAKQVEISENFVVGGIPSAQTNDAILFSRPDSGGKTELRVIFQTGTSILIAKEA